MGHFVLFVWMGGGAASQAAGPADVWVEPYRSAVWVEPYRSAVWVEPVR